MATEGQGHPGLAHILKTPKVLHRFLGATEYSQTDYQFSTLSAKVTKVHNKLTSQRILEALINIYREADANTGNAVFFMEGETRRKRT